MKLSDLKVGGVYGSEYYEDRKILCIGEHDLFLSFIKNSEIRREISVNINFFLLNYSLKPETPELFWLWKVKDSCGDMLVTDYFINEDKEGTAGNEVLDELELIEKIPGSAITKDGKKWEGAE